MSAFAHERVLGQTPMNEPEAEIPEGGTEAPEDLPWDGWHPREVADRLADVSAPWGVAAGWALDLFRGEASREHEDTEIAVPRAGFPEIRAVLHDFDVVVVGSGFMWPLEHRAFDVMHQTLFKAKHDRPKDHADFEGTLPLLGPERRRWLRETLAGIHPRHPWLERL